MTGEKPDKSADPFALRMLDWLLGAPTALSDVQRFVPVLLVVIAALVAVIAAVLVATRL